MSNGFNWQMASDRGLATKIRQEVIKSKGQINPDYDRDYNNEVREATNGKHTELLIRIKKEHKEQIEKALQRREAVGKGKR